MIGLSDSKLLAMYSAVHPELVEGCIENFKVKRVILEKNCRYRDGNEIFFS